MSLDASNLRLNAELALARVRLFPALLVFLSLIFMLLCFVVLPHLAEMALKEGATVRKLKQLPKMAAAAPKDPLVEFKRILLPESAQHQFLRALSRQASSAGLQTGRIDFHAEPGGAVGFSRLTIVIPVAASYPVLQAFAFGLLAEFPGLALEKIALRREQATQDGLDAQLRFVLYVETAP